MNIIYDLGVYPASYDFLQWLVNVRIALKQKGIERFNVCFKPGPVGGFRSDEVARPITARQTILDNVMRPALRLVGAQEVDYGEEVPVIYLERYAVEHAKKGAPIPFFDIPKEYTEEVERDYAGRSPLVLTLREANYYPQRNSNLKAWKKFARLSGQDCIFVRDTAMADEPLGNHETCPRASKDLLYRAALMRKARCNLLVSNGPVMLARYSPTPWLIFGCLRPEMWDWSPGQAKWWEKQIGVPPGSQFPWATKQQLIWWELDEFEHIEQAWDIMSKALRAPKRRTLTKHWKEQFENFKRASARYNDESMRIETVEMYEGVDDKPADMIVACNILERIADPIKAIREINDLARKQILLTIQPDAVRDEKTWRRIIEGELLINDWEYKHGYIAAYCQSGMQVRNERIKVVGAMSDDDRWKHVENALAKVTARIQPKPAHKQPCIIACYGPSLKTYWPKLQEVREQTGSAVVSVSGAHDFLLEKGIVPDFHVECDPRPHKTQNIAQPHPSVHYLIASACHPSLFERLNGANISLWHVAAGQHLMKLIDEKHEHRDTTVSGGGSVGLRAIPLMHRLGYRDFHIFGMDCSFEETGRDEKGEPIVEQWAGKHFGKRHGIDTAQCGDRIFWTSPVLVSYASHFFSIMQRLPGTEYVVYGDSLLQAMCRAYSSHAQIKEVAA